MNEQNKTEPIRYRLRPTTKRELRRIKKRMNDNSTNLIYGHKINRYKNVTYDDVFAFLINLHDSMY